MDAANWTRIQALLDAALASPPAARAALLERECADDPALRSEVEALLACEDALPDELPGGLWTALADEAPQPAWIGRRIGAFEIDALLGEGGSSAVYAAHRSGDFHQRVAIKLLRTPGESFARRFAIERETLARLSHPHIGKLHDAGHLADGTPYLVLELIEGRDWSRWLEQERPPLGERLAQFLAICGAVEYAHQQLLVHRDIKPSNLMIDRAGRAMLLDFGIAKLLDEDPRATLTREGGMVLTPDYAAPEQLRAEPVSTATDVYALGLVLFETLTGQHPFREEGGPVRGLRLRDPLLAPRRPSQVVAASPLGIAASRLRGDLDNIVLKALEAEPARRYASVAALAADLRAFRDGRPVAARAASWRYVAGKFIGRHPLGTALTAMAVLCIAAALSVAVQETRRARHHLGQARAFAHDILSEYPEEIARLPGSLPVQARMVRDGLRYLDTLRPEAGADAALAQELAAGYLRIGDLQGNPYQANLGDLSGAAHSYALAGEALVQWQGLAPGATGQALLRARLEARLAALDHQQSRLVEADRRFRVAIAAFEALPAGERDAGAMLENAAALDFHGDLLGNSAQASLLDSEAGAARHAQARALIETALERFPDDSELQLARAASLQRAGDDAFGARDLEAAIREYRASIAWLEGLLARDPERVALRRELAGGHSRLAQVLDLSGDLDGAIVAAAQSAAIIESLLAADPTNDMMRQGAGAGTGVLAKMLIRAGRHAEAGPVIDRQIAVARKRLEGAPDNAEMILALSLGFRRRGEQLAGLGDFPAAVVAHEEALRLQTGIASQSADNESHRALTLLHLGRVERAAGDRDAALVCLAEAIAAMEALVAAHPEVPVFREDLIDAEEALGDTLPERSAARAHYRRALALIDAVAGDPSLAAAFGERRAALERKAGG